MKYLIYFISAIIITALFIWIIRDYMERMRFTNYYYCVEIQGDTKADCYTRYIQE